MIKIKNSFATILLFILFSGHCLAALIPIAARYDGAGGAYGVGYETKVDDYKVIVGAVGGDISAFGGLITKSLSKDLEISLGALSFSNVSLLTAYQRNLADDSNSQYLLNIEGNAYGVGSKLWLISDYLTFNFSALKSTIKFDSYQNDTGEEIDLAGANLLDIETLSLKAGIDFNFFDNPRVPSKGFGINTSLTQVSGRTGQSDQMILDYGIVGIVPIHNHFSFLLKGKFSDAIVDQNKKYDTDQEVRDALGADCSSILDATEQAKCSDLENALVAYILQNNLVGTTSPLGGSSGLRSFREQRFKARHTALYSAEFKTNLSSLLDILKAKDSRVELVLFYDQGFANDDKLELFKENKFSNGAALQFAKAQNSIKLQAASGSDNSNSWSLSFGKSF